MPAGENIVSKMYCSDEHTCELVAAFPVWRADLHGVFWYRPDESRHQINGLQLIHHAWSVDCDMKEDVTVG